MRPYLGGKERHIKYAPQAGRQPGDLFEFLEQEKKRIGDLSMTSKEKAERVRIVQALARTIIQMHRQKVVHRDIKHENILLTANRTPLLGDFGFAVMQDKKIRPEGTPGYMAPELLDLCHSEYFSIEAMPEQDLWSLGVVVYELMLNDFSKFNDLQYMCLSAESVTIENGMLVLRNAQGNLMAPELHTNLLSTATLQEIEGELYTIFRKEVNKCITELREHAIDKIGKPMSTIIASLLELDPEKRMTDDQLEEALRNLSEGGPATSS